MNGVLRTKLIETALEYQNRSYSPYSHYRVGAALLCENGTIYGGCNIENASYGMTNCGERTAIFKAVSEGCEELVKIAIVGGKVGEKITEYAYPCGVCRQVMAEFSNPKELKVLVAKSEEEYLEMTLEELFPNSFGGHIWSI